MSGIQTTMKVTFFQPESFSLEQVLLSTMESAILPVFCSLSFFLTDLLHMAMDPADIEASAFFVCIPSINTNQSCR